MLNVMPLCLSCFQNNDALEIENYIYILIPHEDTNKIVENLIKLYLRN